MALFFTLRQKLRSHSLDGRHSLAFLNLAQFFGVLNDNIFKLVMVYLAIEVQGPNRASGILSAAGATFVIPFLLFSSAAGVLADRFSKQRLLILMKVAEMLIMMLAVFAFAWKIVWVSYVLLFLLATHSAAFGPSKYGIIPELVTKQKVSRANGLITSFTYLAVILGTFLASFLTDITNHGFIMTAMVCFGISVIGFLCALAIKKTPASGSKKKINPLFFQEIYRTFVSCKHKKHLRVTIFGASYFLFIGAYTQLNIIPFTIQSLGMNEVAGGYLFLTTALGIALGAFIAGKALKRRIELGITCIAGALLALFLILLALFSHHLYIVIALLILLGFCGGMFIVPFDTFIQVNSPDEKRGQVIAVVNFLSFCGVLLASFALYFFSDILYISSAAGFGVMGVLTLLFSIFLLLRMSDLVLHFFCRKIYRNIKVKGIANYENEHACLLVLEKANFLQVSYLLSVVPQLHLFFPKQRRPSFPYFRNLFYSIHRTASVDHMANILADVEKEVDKGSTAALLLRKESSFDPLLFKKAKVPVLYVTVNIEKRTITFSK